MSRTSLTSKNKTSTNSSNSNNNNNKYGTTYQTIRQLLKDDYYDPHSTTTATNTNTNTHHHVDLEMIRKDMSRLDELRRILCVCWIENDYCSLQQQLQHHHNGRNDHNNNNKANNNNNNNKDNDTPVATDATIEKWYTFLRNSRTLFVQQLCQRIISTSNSNNNNNNNIPSSSSQYRYMACRTFWGIIAGTPSCVVIKVHHSNNNNNNNSNITSSNIRVLPMIDVQLLQCFVRTIAGVPVKEDEKENKQDDTNDTDDAWTLRSNDTENKALYQFLYKECIQPYRDVQYYIMSAIHTVCNEIYTTNNNSNHVHVPVTNCCSVHGIERMMELLFMIPSLSSSKSAFDTTSTKTLIETPTSMLSSNYRNRTTTTSKHRNKSNNENDDDEKEEDDDDDGRNEQEDDEEEDTDEEEDIDDDDEENDNDHTIKTKNNIPSYQNRKRYIHVMTKAWLSLLRLRPLSEYILKQSLLHLPKYLLPITSTPLRFADFFHHAYGSSNNNNNNKSNNNSHANTMTTTTTTTNANTTVVSILALEGLFYLMIEHGLEYTNYYKQLYRLLHTSSIYYIKYRMTFLKLLYNSIMKNDTLPTHIVAAFTKRLLRQALYASPSTIMYLLTFVSNILRKHPEMACLIHRNGDSGGASSTDTFAVNDPYDATTDDPELCNALQSSLWELNALQYHYYSGVVTLAKSIGTERYQQTLPYDCTGEFLSITYTTLFEQERSRNKKQSRGKNSDAATSTSDNHKRRRTEDVTNPNSSTPLAFRAPTTLFHSNDMFSAILSIPKVENNTTNPNLI